MTTYIGNKPAGAKDYVTDTPIGSIMAWSKATLPIGWIECNGQSTNGYPDLASIVGANVPDLRGEFIRGADNGRGIDAGRIIGSSQLDALQEHDHYNSVQASATGFGTGDLAAGDGLGNKTWQGATIGVNADDTLVTNPSRVADETRPRNVAQIYIIRAFDVIKEDGSLITYIGHNYIINPDFRINQRQYDGVSLAPHGTYIYDRWKVSGSPNIAWAIDANGFITAPVNYSLQTVVEKVDGLIGEQVTLSWEGTAKAWIYYADGQVFTGQHTSPHTFTVSSDGASVDTLDVFGFTDGTFKNVKLEKGSTPTPFEIPEPVEEFVRCMRYYQRYTPYNYGGIGTKRCTGGGANLEGLDHIHLQVPLRLDGSRGATITCVEATTGAIYANVILVRTGATPPAVTTGETIEGWISHDTTTGNKEGTVAVLSVYATGLTNGAVYQAEYAGGVPELQLFADF